MAVSREIPGGGHGVEKGVLYVVATPIGNLEDITYRAVRILREADLIAAEDTRRTRILTEAYGIKTPITSLHEHNEAKKASFLIEKLRRGSTIAYCCDAGTPGVSDPGTMTVRRVVEAGLRVVPLPGPSALITALSASGVGEGAFVFLAFLPSHPSRRREALRTLRDERRTLIFYESPRRLAACLHDCLSILGNRHVVVARELTKIHEEFMRGSLEEVCALVGGRTIKGEVTVIVAGGEGKGREIREEDIRRRLRELAAEGVVSRRELVRQVARETGIPRSLVYRLALEGDFP